MQKSISLVNNIYSKKIGVFYSYDCETDRFYKTTFNNHLNYLFCISNKHDYFIIVEYNDDYKVLNKIKNINLTQTNIKLLKYKNFYYPDINKTEIKNLLISLFNNANCHINFEFIYKKLYKYFIMREQSASEYCNDLVEFRNHLIVSQYKTI